MRGSCLFESGLETEWLDLSYSLSFHFFFELLILYYWNCCSFFQFRSQAHLYSLFFRGNRKIFHLLKDRFWWLPMSNMVWVRFHFLSESVVTFRCRAFPRKYASCPSNNPCFVRLTKCFHDYLISRRLLDFKSNIRYWFQLTHIQGALSWASMIDKSLKTAQNLRN